MNLEKNIKIKLFTLILITCNIFCIENNYSDLQNMILDIKPFEDEIDYGFLNAEYDEEKISNITIYQVFNTFPTEKYQV